MHKLLWLLAVASPYAYWENDGYTVMREEHGCALYIDYASRSTIRVSKRYDGRVFLSVYNPLWERLASVNNATFTLTLDFTHIRVGAAAIFFRNVNGSMGFSSDGFDQRLLGSFGREPKVKMNFIKDGQTQTTIEEFDLGNPMAISKLRECAKSTVFEAK